MSAVAEAETAAPGTAAHGTAQGTAAQGAAQGTMHLHLTRRGRVVLTTLAALPLVAVALVLALNGGVAAADDAGAAGAQTIGFEYVTIAPGQSLWQLALSVAPTSDPRDTIAEIVSLNQLTSDSLQPGQRLALPSNL